MNSAPRILDLKISRSNIDNQVAAFLYATGNVPRDAEIIRIGYDAAAFIGDNELVPLRVIIKEREQPTDQVVH